MGWVTKRVFDSSSFSISNAVVLAKFAILFFKLLKLLVTLMSRFIAHSARISVDRHTQTNHRPCAPMVNNWRAGASQPSRTTGTIFLYLSINLSVRPTTCINCGTLYATPVGPRAILERIRRKLYVYFKNTSTFRISGIYR